MTSPGIRGTVTPSIPEGAGPGQTRVNLPRRRKGLVPCSNSLTCAVRYLIHAVTSRPRSVADIRRSPTKVRQRPRESLAMPEPTPLSNSVTASILNGQPYDLAQELVRGVQGQFPNASRLKSPR